MAATSSRRGVLIGLGALSIVVGLVAAVALWNIGEDRRRDAVEGFARAPVGCDTTLDFVETGRYFVFIETAGRLDSIRGDCDVEGVYDVGSGTPDVEITIVDPDGNLVDLDRAVTDVDYSEAGFVGDAAFTIDIAETDDHVVRVESADDAVFVVAVGRDPSDGVALLRGGAVAFGMLGLLLGSVLVLLGARRSNATASSSQWAPGAVSPPPPTFTAGRAPQGPPVFGQQAGPPQGPPVFGQQAGPPQGPPVFGQPPPPPPYGQVAPSSRPFQRPGPPSVPGEPSLPGQPGRGYAAPAQTAAPLDSDANAHALDWAPQGGTDNTAVPADAAPRAEDPLGQLRDERESGAPRTQEPPPPPSPG